MLFGGRGGNDTVGNADDMCFAVESLLRRPFAGVLGNQIFHVAQCMEHVNNRRMGPGALQLFRHQSGEPVVAVDQVIMDALGFGKSEDALRKLIQVVAHFGHGNRFFRAGGNVDHAAPWS